MGLSVFLNGANLPKRKVCTKPHKVQHGLLFYVMAMAFVGTSLGVGFMDIHAGQVFKTFFQLGCTSFGGPVAHLGYFRKAFVEDKKWVSDDQYAGLLALCQFLPGPASSQMGMAIGHHLAGIRGMLAAFVGFTLPSFLLMWLAAVVITSDPFFLSDGMVAGLKAVAVAVVAQAIMGMARNLCPDLPRMQIAVAAAVVMLVFGGIFLQLLVVVGAAALGYFMFDEQPKPAEEIPTDGFLARWAKPILITFIALFFVLAFLAASTGFEFFVMMEVMYRAGALVFGGGHVVLPFLETGMVGLGLVDHDDFLAGYGLAQALPGPLFTFASFLGGAMDGGAGSLINALMACLMIFLPGMLLLMGVLPYWSKLAADGRVRSALTGVNAAVVGLLMAAFYDPVLVVGVQTGWQAAVVVIAYLLLEQRKMTPWKVVIIGALLGLILGGFS